MYIIWIYNESINSIRKSENIFIYGSFYLDHYYKHLIIIMYKYIITGLKIPLIYILVNGKKEILYIYIFKIVYNIITEKNKIQLK